ncbi:MAG: dehydrogenase [Paraprevotella sp.]|nr:dehydrogenase [Paraprevotella sp.]
MADNYLEKRRELYEERKAVWEKANKDKAKKLITNIRGRIV